MRQRINLRWIATIILLAQHQVEVVTALVPSSRTTQLTRITTRRASSTIPRVKPLRVQSPLLDEDFANPGTEEFIGTTPLRRNDDAVDMKDEGIAGFLSKKVGKVDDERLVFPELNNGEVPRMFSSLKYVKSEDGSKVKAVHAAGSVVGAASLVAGTTVGAGVLALPTATAAAGFLPSTVAMLAAWAYMTMSGLLIAELSINRMGATGRPGLGLLDLFESYLGKPWSAVGSTAYFFLHYAVMVAYIAQGGANLEQFIGGSMGDLPHGFGQVATAVTCALALYVARPGAVEKVNNALVGGVVATFLCIVGLGVGSADFGALIAPANQHPEEVVNAFPILFLAMVFQNIVPTVTYQLEGDRDKITTAIVVGTTLPMLMFLAWNAVILGNVMGIDPTLLTQEDPVQLLQSLSDGAVLGNLVGAFSELALVTSLIGFVYGLRDAWTDVLGIDQNKVEEYERYKPLLFAGIFAPPLLLSMANPDIFYHALDYGGAFGVSTLFLVLPPIMVWKQRYGEDNEPLSTKPMVPLGKIPLGSMWKAAATLIIEQGADKLGIVDFFREQM